MKITIRHILVGATMSIVALGASACEATAGPGGRFHHFHMQAEDHHKRMSPQKFEEKRAQRQAELRQKLNLSSAQEPAWNAYVAAMTPPEPGQRPDRAERDKLTAPERMERALQGMKQMEAHLTKQLNAMKALYAQLTPEQRAIFDEHSKRVHKHRRG